MEEKGHPLLEKIGLLLSRFQDPQYPEDLETIKSMQQEAQRLILTEELCENETLKEILKKYIAGVQKMDEELLNTDSKKLCDVDRDRMLDKKKLYLDFIGTFDVVVIQKSLADVDKEVSDQLASIDA